MLAGIAYLSRPQDTDATQIGEFQGLQFGVDRTYGFRIYRPVFNATVTPFVLNALHEWVSAGGLTHKNGTTTAATTTRSTAAGLAQSATPVSTWGWQCCYGWAPALGTFAAGVDLCPAAAAGTVVVTAGTAGTSRFVIGTTVTANTDMLISVL